MPRIAGIAPRIYWLGSVLLLLLSLTLGAGAGDGGEEGVRVIWMMQVRSRP